MKRKLVGCLATMLLCSLAPQAKAQSLTQLLEQLEFDYQKLAQLKQMLADMQSGYRNVYAGYERVRSIAAGNFNLHKAFLDALLAVSPPVRDYVKVQHIVASETALVNEYRSAKLYFAGPGRFSTAEMDAITALYSPLLDGSLRNLEELTDVLTDNTLRMSDAERLAAIDRIDRDMTGRLGTLQAFDNASAIQAGQRAMEQHDIGTMQGLYGGGH